MIKQCENKKACFDERVKEERNLNLTEKLVCKRCRKAKADPDHCLGNLPGVRNACCGHGEIGYIEFNNGTVIRGNFWVCQWKTGKIECGGDNDK